MTNDRKRQNERLAATSGSPLSATETISISLSREAVAFVVEAAEARHVATNAYSHMRTNAADRAKREAEAERIRTLYRELLDAIETGLEA